MSCGNKHVVEIDIDVTVATCTSFYNFSELEVYAARFHT